MIKRLKWSWVIAALTVLLGAFALSQVDPNTQIPIHWDIDGNVDRTASAWIGFLIIPGIQALLLVMFSSLPYLEPRQKNLEDSAKAFKALIFAITLLQLLIQGMIVDQALGWGYLGFNAVFFGIGLLLMVMGNYFSKLRSSFFIGIRTPWTLSSETVWQKTHRLGGRLFVVTGLLLAAASLILEYEQLPIVLLSTAIPASSLSGWSIAAMTSRL